MTAGNSPPVAVQETRSYFDTLRALGERYFEVWTDECAVILATHKSDCVTLSAEFGIDLQAIADALGPNPTDAEIFAALAGDAGLADNNLILDWLMLEKGGFGGVYGARLVTGVVPIFSPAEVLAFKGNVREHPPMYLWWHQTPDSEKFASPQALGARLGARMLGDPGHQIVRAEMPEGEISTRFDNLINLLFAELDTPRSVGVEGPAVRAAYHAFAKAFWPWAISTDAVAHEVTTSPRVLSGALPKQTFAPLHRMEQAVADGPRFVLSRDGSALVHRVTTADRKKDPIEVILAPIDNPTWFPPATVDDLRSKLLAVDGTLASFMFAVTVSLAVENQRVDLDLDEFIRILGLDPRSTEQRRAMRHMLWQCLQLFAQLSAVGEIEGKYRDAKGNPITYIENSPAIAITGRRYPREMLLDGSETPVRVGFVAGDFLDRHRTNRKLLASLGNLRQLAIIPSGQAVGRWARIIGLTLLQYTREQSASAEIKRVGEDSHTTVKIKPITRRDIFARIKLDPEPHAILGSNNPARAREYWDGAMDILRNQKSAVLIPAAHAKPLPRQGWREPWLDEPLDIRPHPGNAALIESVQSISDGAKAWRKKRGRPKKKSP
jgi:hypothetical protein